MPDERSSPSVDLVQTYQHSIEALLLPLTEDEAVGLLDVFPEDDGEEQGSLYELEGPLLHAIETAPYGAALRAALDDRSAWVRFLRERAQRGGLL